jgi:hypothetical protein
VTGFSNLMLLPFSDTLDLLKPVSSSLSSFLATGESGLLMPRSSWLTTDDFSYSFLEGPLLPIVRLCSVWTVVLLDLIFMPARRDGLSDVNSESIHPYSWRNPCLFPVLTLIIINAFGDFCKRIIFQYKI